MTTGIAEPQQQPSHRPVLRRLVDILPAEVPMTCEPPQLAVAPTVDPAASIRAERVLRAMVEILGGQRSARQLATVLCPDVLVQFVALREKAGHLQPRVHKVLVHPQAPGVVEAVAVVIMTTGVRALAARFEQHIHDERHRWQCTALQLRLTAGDLRRGHQPRRPRRGTREG